MEALHFEENKAEKIMFSEQGHRIEPGELYIEIPYHGRTAVMSLSEYETKFLGLRDFSTADRKKLASSGAALPDGSYPIANCSDAANAIHAIGRAKPSDRDKVKAHIRSRVKALGCSGSTFDNWK
jgi:hypothetical protein